MSDYPDPALCVISRQGVYYWWPTTGSRWRGDPDDCVWVPALDWPQNAPIPPDPQLAQNQPPERSPPRQRQQPDECRLCESQRDSGTRLPAQHQAPLLPSNFAEARSPPPYHSRDAFGPSRGHASNPYANFPVEFRGPVISHDDLRRMAPQGPEHRAPYRPPAPHTTQPAQGPDRRDGYELRRDEYHHNRREMPREHTVEVGRDHGYLNTTRRVERGERNDLRDRRGGPRVKDNAAADDEGYPIFPLLLPVGDDESDYGGLDADDSGEEGARAHQDILNKECIRHEDARANKAPRQTPANVPPPPRISGSDAMVKHIVWVYGQYPLLRRSEGTLYLMREGNTAYLFAATGDATPISRRNGRVPTHNACRNKAIRRSSSSSTTTMSTAGTSHDGDELMPPVPMPAGQGQSYVGFLPIPEPACRDQLGPQVSLSDVIGYYEGLPTSQWVQGVRDEHGHGPTRVPTTGVSPHVGDLMASRLIHYLSPPHDADASSIHHIRWRNMVLSAFSVRGLFKRYMEIGGWVGAFAPLEQYPFNTLNMALSEALQWVHAHGVPANSDTSRVIHEYALSWCNRRENAGDPHNTEFAGEYPTPASAWPTERITQWADIRHGTLRVGASSAYAQTPGVPPTTEEDSEMTASPRIEEGEVSEGSGNGPASVTPGGP
ncbi:hypothetical protein K438DRAFT_1784606 [Mycena galopus ATCC 62051]|nr:hypothetical protein K438DRAFT_1784606 [Mycena galopus ATCC 62051]